MAGLARAVVAVAVLAAAACGGIGTAAPPTIGADEDTGCPSAEDALAHTRAALQGAGLDELTPVMQHILDDDGGVRVLIQGLAVILTQTTPGTARRFVSDVDIGLGPLTPHLTDVLHYVDGSSPYVEGAHPAPVASLHAVLATCDAVQNVSTLRALLELEVADGPDGPVLVTAGAGAPNQRAWLTAVVESARAAVEDPAVRAVLEQIRLDDGEADAGTGGVHVGRDAFALLAKLVAANLAAPNFDPDYTRGLIDDVVLSRITDPAARARADELVALLLLVSDERADVFPQVQALMQCVNEADADAAIPGMLYDWLTIPALTVDGFLDDLSTSTGSAADVRLALAEVLRALEANPHVTTDLVRVSARFLDADTAPIVVRALLALQGKGVVREVAHIVDAIQACRR